MHQGSYTCKQLKLDRHLHDIEGIFIEVNLRKTKWLLFATDHPPLQVDQYFFDEVGKSLNKYNQKYVKFLLIGDFNSFMAEVHII